MLNTLSDAQVVVSSDVVALLDRLEAAAPAETTVASDDRETLETLEQHGFVVGQPSSERAALESRFVEFREDASELRITILTTLQCNFACGYCYQGDHGDGLQTARTMSLDTAAQVAAWIARQVDEVKPRRLVLTFFGGEPLLNMPVMIALAKRCWRHAESRGVRQLVNIITNGLLLTTDIVNRMTPFGLNGVKVTLDGDRGAHDSVRPLRGGQGTFDRIVDNLRRVAPLVPVTIGGNFDAATADSYPALLDFLGEQDFAGRIAKVAFKPIITPAERRRPKGVIPLTPVDANREPFNLSCMTAAGAATGWPGGSACANCHADDEKMSFLREETRRRGFVTDDGVHMGPCDLYRRHSHTVGPDGSLYACPGFTGDNALSVGHIDGSRDAGQAVAAGRFERLAPWRRCGDCAFIPVCGGGCAVAAHAELGDMEAPSCHKPSFESALISLAEEAAGAPAGGIQ